MGECEVIQVIRTTLARRGKGIEGDPVRVLEQYWSLDGKLLWEIDPCGESNSKAEGHRPTE